MIEEKVREMLNHKEWTLAELQDIKGLVSLFSNEIYGDMNAKEKLDMIWDETINFQESNFGEDIMREITMIQIQSDVAGTIKNMLGNATINFGGNENEVSEGSMGGKPHKKRSSNEEKDSILEE